MLMFEMCLSGAAECLNLTLSNIIKKDVESLADQFNHDKITND